MKLLRLSSCQVTSLILFVSRKLLLEGVCTMNYNYIFEKLYIILYFLFMILTVVASFQLALQVLLALSPGSRTRWIIWTFGIEMDSAREVQRILGYPQFLLFMLIYSNSTDELNVKTIIKNMIKLRRHGVFDRTRSESQIATFDIEDHDIRRRNRPIYI